MQSSQKLICSLLGLVFFAEAASAQVADDASFRFAKEQQAARARMAKADCGSDFYEIWNRQTAIAQKKISIYEQEASGYATQLKQLQEDNIWGLFGVELESVEAQKIVAFLSGVSTGANLFNNAMDTLIPKNAALKSTMDGASSLATNGKELIDKGWGVKEIIDSESSPEILYRTMSAVDLNKGPTKLVGDLALDYADYKDTLENQRDYAATLKNAMQKLQWAIEKSGEKIRIEEEKVRELTREGFEKFCSENIPPVAVNDYAEAPAEPGAQIRVAVLQNDYDPDGSPLRLVGIGGGRPSKGRVSIAGGATVADPSDDFLIYTVPDLVPSSEIDEVSYSIIDEGGAKAEARVFINIKVAYPEPEQDELDDILSSVLDQVEDDSEALRDDGRSASRGLLAASYESISGMQAGDGSTHTSEESLAAARGALQSSMNAAISGNWDASYTLGTGQASPADDGSCATRRELLRQEARQQQEFMNSEQSDVAQRLGQAAANEFRRAVSCGVEYNLKVASYSCERIEAMNVNAALDADAQRCANQMRLWEQRYGGGSNSGSSEDSCKASSYVENPNDGRYKDDRGVCCNISKAFYKGVDNRNIPRLLCPGG